MLNQIAQDDILIADLEATKENIDIHFYYIDRVLTDQSYIFNGDDMKQWWQDGYELFQHKNPERHILNLSDKEI